MINLSLIHFLAFILPELHPNGSFPDIKNPIYFMPQFTNNMTNKMIAYPLTERSLFLFLHHVIILISSLILYLLLSKNKTRLLVVLAIRAFWHQSKHFTAKQE